MLALVALILLFTFVGRIIGVDGSSMYPTLHHGDMLLLQSVGYEPKQGDVVVLTKAFRDVDGPSSSGSSPWADRRWTSTTRPAPSMWTAKPWTSPI